LQRDIDTIFGYTTEELAILRINVAQRTAVRVPPDCSSDSGTNEGTNTWVAVGINDIVFPAFEAVRLTSASNSTKAVKEEWVNTL
jgi:hypothetical protein